MEITVTIPDELARLIVPEGLDPSRQAIEDMAVEAYRAHRLTGCAAPSCAGHPLAVTPRKTRAASPTPAHSFQTHAWAALACLRPCASVSFQCSQITPAASSSQTATGTMLNAAMLRMPNLEQSRAHGHSDI